jgi:methylated-DNA-protein-cysteine methyltransferase-like protein
MDFKSHVLALMNQVPSGRVVSYGQIAAAAGSPRAARQVGGILRALPIDTSIPWWRVVNNEGYISIRGNWVADKPLQKKLLEDEGIKVTDTMNLDMDTYRYKF